jgi:GT2 family glycosyltransferase
MTNKKEVSVIIPAYQSAHLLPRCLEALSLNQEIKEIIVVNDASTDDTDNVLQTFPVNVIRHDTNRGPVVARNTGAAQATGKYLLFLDSDIELAPNYISGLSKFLNDHPKTGIVSGRIESPQGERVGYNFSHPITIIRSAIGEYVFQRTSRFWQKTFLKPWLNRLAGKFNLNFVPDQEMQVGYVIEQAFMTRRELFKKLGGFDENFFIFHEGADYAERVRREGWEIWYSPAVTAVHHNLRSHSKRRNVFRRQSMRYYLRKHGLRLW